MPLQNRVDPFGNLFRTSSRGTIMGNRGGAIHNPQQEIVRPYQGRRWISCVLKFRGLRRKVMTPNRYTELFFLDEAVALAAGHRPCAECRRERYNAFRDAWMKAAGLPRRPSAEEMDVELHAARIAGRAKVFHEAPYDSLPDGCFVQIAGSAYLVLGDALLLWTPEGYTERRPRPKDSIASVLTPSPIVKCLRAGYRPEMLAEKRTLVYGHRGARARRPENTIEGFSYAIAVGVDAIELDVWARDDGLVLVSHDPPPDGAPTLDDIFALADRGHFDFNVEMKGGPDDAAPVLARVRAHRLQRRVIVSSFNFQTLAAMRQLAPGIRLSALIENDDRPFADISALAAHAEMVAPQFRLVTAEKVAAAHTEGIRVVAWTVNQSADWSRMIAAQVDAIITDDPEALKAFLRI